MADAPEDSSGLVVSDTTPLIVLAGIGLLHLLPAVYGEVSVTDEVWSEYSAGASDTDPRLEDLPWLHRRSLSKPIDASLAAQLDSGEASTIALAEEVEARAVLLDERLGRRIAHDRDLPVVGSLAVLLRAKREGHIPAVGPYLAEMIGQGRRVSPTLRAQVLHAAGED